MTSPFPGMGSYLEDPAFWPDFHLTFVGCWREAIADALPDSYEARLDERVNLVQMSPEVIKLTRPDVADSQGPPAPHRTVSPAVQAPFCLIRSPSLTRFSKKC